MQSREEYHRTIRRWMAEDRHDSRQLHLEEMAERRRDRQAHRDETDSFWRADDTRFYAPLNDYGMPIA